MNSFDLASYFKQVLLHAWAVLVLWAVASNTTDPGIAARTMANIADVMGCMAGKIGGLRSGPAANQSWRKAFNYLEVSGEISEINEMRENIGQFSKLRLAKLKPLILSLERVPQLIVLKTVLYLPLLETIWHHPSPDSTGNSHAPDSTGNRPTPDTAKNTH